MTAVRGPVNGPREKFLRRTPPSPHGMVWLRARQRDNVVALSGKRLSLEPTVDGLDLEPREPEHQLQLPAPDGTDGEVVHPPLLQHARYTVQLVEEAHL